MRTLWSCRSRARVHLNLPHWKAGKELVRFKVEEVRTTQNANDLAKTYDWKVFNTIPQLTLGRTLKSFWRSS